MLKIEPGNQTLLSFMVIVMAYVVSIIMAYALIQLLMNKMTIRNAVKAAQAYWDEDRRQQNLRLFGDENA